MREYFLKLNSGKTKIMIVAPEGIKREIVINGTFISRSVFDLLNVQKILVF